MSNPSPFELHRTAMLMTAVQIRQARINGEPTDKIVPQVLPQNLGNLSRQAQAEARHAQAEVTVGARVLERHADYADRIELGGVDGRIAKMERWVSLRLNDRLYLREELDPAGLIAVIRSKVA